MQIRKLFCIMALISIVAVAVIAADVTGKWKAESTGPNGQTRTTNFTFKAEGAKLTGTISGRQGDTPIADGKIDGDEISFVVVRNMQGQERKIEYKGKVAGDEIKLSVQFGPDMPAREMVAKRVKE